MQVVQNTFGTPQLQIIEKSEEFPATRSAQDANESDPPTCASTPAIDALPVVMERAQPAPVDEIVDEHVAPEPVVTYTVPAPVNEHVAPELAIAPVVKFATPVPAVTHPAPTPVVESGQVPQVQIVEKTIEIPQRQIVEKIVEIPEIWTIQGTQTSESLATAPVRQAAPAETVEVVELGPPLSAESAPPVFATAPLVEAAPVVVEYVQPAHHVVEWRPLSKSSMILFSSFTGGQDDERGN